MKLKLEFLDELVADLSTRTVTPKIPVGIADLDSLIWGLHKKELLTIAARPSHGKTSLAINMAWNAAKLGASVIFLSLEMSSGAVMERIMCSEFDLHGWRLRTGDVNEIKKALSYKDKFASRLLTTPIEIFDNVGRTIDSVEKILTEMKPDVLFIDYLQKITQRGFGNKYEALSDYVVKLQSLAIQHNCAIVMLSQISRGGSKAGDATDYLKGSGEIEESTDGLLQCEWLFRNDPSRMDREEFLVKAIKQRHGPCSHVTLNFNAGTFKFTNREFKNDSNDFGRKDFN